ncbi:tyrosine-protein phosphatase Lar-like [Littorina saxatilis]|uniref:tyrosine-protein phosphatase Lar-like n=1 Tax=Littorina saxatilis TaxID=31220 RepID=UPI0038B5B254
MMKTTKKKNVVITDVMPHTSYYFRIQARNMAGYGPLSHTVIFNPPTDIRAAPSNVTVWSFYGNISTAVEVMWLKPRLAMGHITGYMVYYTTDDDQSDSNWMIEGERGLSTLILGLMHNVTYYFKVRARYGAGLGPFSGVVSFTTPPEADREEGVWEGDTEQQEVETTTVKPDSVTETSTTPPRTTDFDAFIPETSTVKTPVPPHNWTLDVGTDHVNVTWEPPPTTRQPITNEDVNSTQPISVELDLPVNSTQSNGTQPVVYHTDASTIQPISSEEAQLAESRQPITYQLELLGGAKRDELVTTRIVKDNSYTFTELEEDTSYVVKVKVVTEHGTSPPAIQAFHTLSSSQTVQDDLDR